MKKLDISLGDVYKMSASEVGGQLMQARRKKKTNKRTIILPPEPSNKVQIDLNRPVNPLYIPAQPMVALIPSPSPQISMHQEPRVQQLPPQRINQVPNDQQYKPPEQIPFGMPEVSSWNTTGSPFRNPSPFPGSQFFRHDAYPLSQNDLNSRTPPNVTAFTPYRSTFSHPMPNATFMAFQGIFL